MRGAEEVGVARNPPVVIALLAEAKCHGHLQKRTRATECRLHLGSGRLARDARQEQRPMYFLEVPKPCLVPQRVDGAVYTHANRAFGRSSIYLNNGKRNVKRNASRGNSQGGSATEAHDEAL